jgi:PAS domain S-box-containing protein
MKPTDEANQEWCKLFLHALDTSNDYLLEQTYKYVDSSGYTRIVSSRETEWRKGIGGISYALSSTLHRGIQNDFISINTCYQKDELSSFIREEAFLHRARGVKLDMFLAVLKLMRRPFEDLAINLNCSADQSQSALNFVQTMFDRFELSCCAEWMSHDQNTTINSLQELNIHMTNEKNRYQLIFESMAEPSYVVDPQMRLVAVNRAFESFFGLDRREVFGHVCERFFNCGFCEYCYLFDAMKRRTSFSNIETVLKVKGRDKTVLISGSFVDDFSGTHSGGMAIFQDITDRKWAEDNLRRARNTLEDKVKERTHELTKSNRLLNFEIDERKNIEKALRASEERYRALVESSTDHIFLLKLDGQFVTSNNKHKHISNDFIKNLTECKIQEVYPSNVYAKFREAIQTTITKKTDSSFEYGIIIEQKCYFHYVVIYPIYRDKDIVFLGGIDRDVTDKKNADITLQESEKKLRLLSNSLLAAQENERKRIAFDLHDELGQSLVALKIRLRNIGEQLNSGLDLQLEECMNSLHSITDYVRKMSKDLSPSMLKDLGLIPAIRSLFKQMAELYKLEIKVSIDQIESSLPEDTKINIFRIFQETLTNIGKHAQASLVSVDITQDDGTVYCNITDNGIGFDTAQVAKRRYNEKGLGLLAIEERVNMLDGHIKIVSHPGNGTRIYFSFPISAENSNGALSHNNSRRS